MVLDVVAEAPVRLEDPPHEDQPTEDSEFDRENPPENYELTKFKFEDFFPIQEYTTAISFFVYGENDTVAAENSKKFLDAFARANELWLEIGDINSFIANLRKYEDSSQGIPADQLNLVKNFIDTKQILDALYVEMKEITETKVLSYGFDSLQDYLSFFELVVKDVRTIADIQQIEQQLEDIKKKRQEFIASNQRPEITQIAEILNNNFDLSGSEKEKSLKFQQCLEVKDGSVSINLAPLAGESKLVNPEKIKVLQMAFQKILDRILSSLEENENGSFYFENPAVFFVVGPPGVGKTTQFQKVADQCRFPIVDSDPDKYKRELFNELLSQKFFHQPDGTLLIGQFDESDSVFMDTFHEYSSILSRLIFWSAIALKLSVVDQSSGSNKERLYMQAQEAYDNGNIVFTLAVEPDEDFGIAESVRRSMQRGRGVPINQIFNSISQEKQRQEIKRTIHNMVVKEKNSDN